MFIARWRPPKSCTSPTPGERSSWILITLSAYSVSSRSDRLPERAIDITGELSLLNFETTGGCTSSGSLRTTPAMRSRMSCAALSMSRLRLKVAITNEVLPEEIERSSSMPSTVLTASSMICETSDSGSSVEGPGGAGRGGGDGGGRQVDGGEAVHAQPAVARRAHHHQGEDDHGREHRPADTDLGELLHYDSLRNLSSRPLPRAATQGRPYKSGPTARPARARR